MTPLLLAMAFVVVGALAEAVCAGGDAAAVMKTYQQPRWALPMAAWYVVGILYYAICFTIVYRTQASGQRRFITLMLMGCLMLANAAWNLLFFRWRALRSSVWFYLPYTLLVIILIINLWSTDRFSAAALLIYCSYLPYALVWSHRVLELNRGG